MVSVALIKFLDKYAGSAICLFLSVFSRKKAIREDASKFQRIALIQLWGIGETVLCLPTLKHLRQKYPKATIDIITTNRVDAVFCGNKDINAVRIVSLGPFSVLLFILKNRRKYDLAIDMEEYLKISAIMAFFLGKHRIGYDHGFRSGLYSQSVHYNDDRHVVQTFLDLLQPLGIRKKADKLEALHYSKKDLETAKRIIGKTKKPLIAISAGAAESGKIRMWPNEKWAALIDFLEEKYHGSVFLIGARDTLETNEDILKKVKNKDHTHNIAGITSVSELFALVSSFELMISIDSGPMHIAAAQGIPTIGLFGPNTPVRFGPFGKKNISIYKPVVKPVINVHRGEIPNSSRIDHMRNIAVSDVREAVAKILYKKRGLA